MASNRDLIAQAITLALALKIEIKTDGLNNKKLVDLVSDLKAKTKDEELTTQADEPKDEPKDDKAVLGHVDDRDPGVYVEDGKAVTSKVGILEAGAQVTAGHLAGGEKALAQLVKGGHCVEVE